MTTVKGGNDDNAINDGVFVYKREEYIYGTHFQYERRQYSQWGPVTKFGCKLTKQCVLS
jgi:hypothetical protein